MRPRNQLLRKLLLLETIWLVLLGLKVVNLPKNGRG
jgi:hypothetical protein